MTAPTTTIETTNDGLLAARIGNTTYAMMPCRDGSFLAYTGSSKPVADLKRGDFYGYSSSLADEVAFRATLDELARDREQVMALGRRRIDTRDHTPWGSSQGATWFADGIICHSTASHGGFELAAYRNAQIPIARRSASGFYEEDCEWAIVAVTFTGFFTDREQRLADQTMRDWHPDVWEELNGRELSPDESRARAETAFNKAHANHWIVCSAIVSSRHPGMVECIARRPCDPAVECRCLVPTADYSAGRFGFVIDPERHQSYDGPSDFIGWSRRAS